MFIKPSRKIHRVFIRPSLFYNYPHHDNIENTRSLWHLSRDFSDIGYHFFIRKDGTLEYGRDIKKTPAAQKGHNLYTLAICSAWFKRREFYTGTVLIHAKLAGQIDHNYENVSFAPAHCESPKSLVLFLIIKKVLDLDRFGSLNKNDISLTPLINTKPE